MESFKKSLDQRRQTALNVVVHRATVYRGGNINIQGQSQEGMADVGEAVKSAGIGSESGRYGRCRWSCTGTRSATRTTAVTWMNQAN